MDKRYYSLPLSLLFALFCSAMASAGVLDSLNKLSPNSFGAEREFLDPNVAFKLSHEIEANVLNLNFDIAPGYYLYRDKMTLATTNPAVSLGELERLEGIMKDDPEFGRVAIYKNQVVLRATLELSGRIADAVSITVGYQGCAEDAICYPPIKKTISISADSIRPLTETPTAPSSSARQSRGELSAGPDQSADDIATALAGRSLFGVAAMFFVFGLLLAFTPCVFPMVPILSGIIVGQKQPVTMSRGLSLSAVYVLAVAATYAGVGLLAGLFGHNLQATFQHPWVIVSFALVFVALAFSMFGFYELQLPAKLQTRLDAMSRAQSGGSLFGVALMGVLSAIIVGPCVAPPLAGALIYLGHQGSALTGGTALFALGLGMGMPLLLVGASAGQILPRAGVWMEAVKRIFGVMLLGVAVWFLERILPGSLTLSMWALLAIVSAIYLGALDTMTSEVQGVRRFAKGLGLALLCYGVILALGAGIGGDSPLRPLEPLVNTRSVSHTETAFEAVKGPIGFDAALARAGARGRPVILDFYADWCVECKHLEKQTFANPTVAAALGDVALLRADVTENDEQDRALLKRFELFGPPAVLLFDRDGEEVRRERIIGFIAPDPFLARLEAIQ